MPDGPASTVGVCFGGPSPEHDVSVLTGLQTARELSRTGRSVTGLYWSKTGEWFEVDPSLEGSAFIEGVPRGADPLKLEIGREGGFVSGQKGRGLLGGGNKQRTLPIAVVVNCCHGGPGEDGTLQGSFDLAGIRYTGPGQAASALGMDKLAFAAVAENAGLNVLPRAALEAAATKEGIAVELGTGGPYILKPRFGGSSIGVEAVADLDTALKLLETNVHLQRGAVIEPFRGDLVDLNIAVRTWPTFQCSAIERPTRTTVGAEILGYADKYQGGEGMVSAPRELPAQIPDSLASEIRRVSSRIGHLVGLRGITRVDFLSDGSGELYLNEVNTIPGSLARYLWVDPPVSFADLLEAMIEEAERVPAARLSAAGADGSVLRMAGSIAGKLG
jgi:D-alanine-D-alanine ligase